jgi:hypothetical protein
MPSKDAARRRLRLSDSHVSVLGLLVEDGHVPDELAQAQAELREAGILDPDDKIVADRYPSSPRSWSHVSSSASR